MHWYQQVPDYQLMQRELDPDESCAFCLWDYTKRTIFLYDARVSTGPCQNVSLDFVSISCYHSHQSHCCWFIVQTSCYDVWQCIFSIAYPSYETRVITLPFMGYCVMIDAEQSKGHFYINLASSENDLNHALSTFVDSEHERTNFCH